MQIRFTIRRALHRNPKTNRLIARPVRNRHLSLTPSTFRTTAIRVSKPHDPHPIALRHTSRHFSTFNTYNGHHSSFKCPHVQAPVTSASRQSRFPDNIIRTIPINLISRRSVNGLRSSNLNSLRYVANTEYRRSRGYINLSRSLSLKLPRTRHLRRSRIGTTNIRGPGNLQYHYERSTGISTQYREPSRRTKVTNVVLRTSPITRRHTTERQ